MFQRGVGELLSVGNGSVYHQEIVERWWWSSEQIPPLVERGFLGTPASLPLQSLYGFGEAGIQLPILSVLGAALFFLSGLWAGGLLFSTVLLMGAWTWSGMIEASPSLFFAAGSLLVWTGVEKERPLVGAAGVVLVSCRLEWALWGLLLLLVQRQWKVISVGFLGVFVLWFGASVFWGLELTEYWLSALHQPSAQVQPGLGVLGLLPGSTGQWIPFWWVFYAGAAAAFWPFCLRMKPASAWAFALAVALWMSPQIRLVDYALMAPLFVAFFPNPERIALFCGLGFLLLAFGNLLFLSPLLAGYGIYLAAHQAHSEF